MAVVVEARTNSSTKAKDSTKAADVFVSWGPEEADRLLAGTGRWHDPWVAS